MLYSFQGYLKHIKNAQETKITIKYLEELFSNVEDIYMFNRYLTVYFFPFKFFGTILFQFNKFIFSIFVAYLLMN